MNWTIMLTMVALSAAGAAPAAEIAIGDRLPELRGKFLTGRDAALPEASSGRVALLLLGFTYDSRFAVEDWTRAFRERFGDDSRVTFYEIPMIGGFARLGKWFIDRGMRRGTPEEYHEHIITVYGGTVDWKERFGYQDPKAAYLLLLGRDGTVAWRYSGYPNAQAFEDLSNQLTRLLSEGGGGSERP